MNSTLKIETPRWSLPLLDPHRYKGAYGGRGSGKSHHFAERVIARYEPHLSKRPLDYYRMFYGDTAVSGNAPALICGYAFFGADHILFGTDMPYGGQLGDRHIRKTILSIEQMDIPEPEKRKIFEDNARKLLRLAI